MTLSEYFDNKPLGSKQDFAKELGITRTWLALIINGQKTPSPTLAIQIHALTKGKVNKKVLRPDIFAV